MSDITFRGEINTMSADYFVRAIERLSPRSAATIYLHTPGGAIYGGGEMVNALRTAINKRGCKVSLELGSLVASMGATLLAAARASGAKVTAHANTEVMFHGCCTDFVGGASALEDQAKALRDFNFTVQDDLRKCGITDTEDWFAEGRMKFLNARELVAMGLVDHIIEDAALDDDQRNDALAIAALYNQETKTMEEYNTITDETAAEVKAEESLAVEAQPEAGAEVAAEEAPAAEAPSPTVADDIEARVVAMANERFAGLQSKHDKMISDLTYQRDALAKDLAIRDTMVTSLQADIEKLEHDLAEVRDQLSKSEQIRESIVVDALKVEPEPRTYAEIIADPKATAEQKLDACRKEAARIRKH